MIILLFLILLLPTEIRSCTCIGVGSAVSSSIRDADAVFVGKVVSVCEFFSFDEKNIEKINKNKQVYSLRLKRENIDSVQIYDRVFHYEKKLNLLYMKKYFQYSFLVEKKYKGCFSSDTLTVVSEDKSLCGFSFFVGQEYVVYACYRDRYFGSDTLVEPFLETDRCTRTSIKNKAHINEIEKALRKKKKSKKRSTCPTAPRD